MNNIIGQVDLQNMFDQDLRNLWLWIRHSFAGTMSLIEHISRKRKNLLVNEILCYWAIVWYLLKPSNHIKNLLMSAYIFFKFNYMALQRAKTIFLRHDPAMYPTVST